METCVMSILEFHAQLVSGNNKNPLFDALRKLRTVANPQSLFDETTNDWPLWEGSVSTAAVTPA